MATDWTLPPRHTGIYGMTGSGKTTFALAYLKRTPAAARFIFDDLGQSSARLKIPLCHTPADLNRALAARWVLYSPHMMFPGDTAAGFRFFCAWLFQASRRGPGRKMFFCDEVWQWQTRNYIPIELAKICQMGRAENLEFITATQRPHRLNDSITGAFTEIICFRLQDDLPLATVKTAGFDPAKIAKLPLGSFISKGTLDGKTTAGRIF